MDILSQSCIAARIRELTSIARAQDEGAFGDQLHIRFLGCNTQHNAYEFSARTEGWMRNIEGVVHGGFCATLADHIMGTVAYCIKTGDRISPTIQLQIAYHRPVLPEEELIVRVRVISATSRLIHLSAEAAAMGKPERVCFSSTATYFCKD